MASLLRTLLRLPLTVSSILLASIMVNILGLSQAIYTIQVLNKYITLGVTETLVTLIIGVLIAITSELIFRVLRTSISKKALKVHVESSREYAAKAVEHSKTKQINPRYYQDVLANLKAFESTSSPAIVGTLFDFPLISIFAVALFYIMPEILWIVLVYGGIMIFAGVLHTVAKGESLELETSNFTDILKWIMAISGVTVIGYASYQAVHGDLNVGLVIGANILAGRMLMNVLKFSSSIDHFKQRGIAEKNLKRLFNV